MFKGFILTLQFLTRLPINIQVDIERDTQAKGTFFFPIIGLIVGGIAAAVYYALYFFSPEVAAIGAVFALIAVTGGFHVDGLSDMADGFFSARSRERILEIMKDSRVGTFGVIAIVFDILFKYILLKSMPQSYGAVALLLSCGCARSGTATIFSIGKTARPGGLGDIFTSNDTTKYAFSGILVFIIIGFFIGKFKFLVAIAAVILSALALMRYSYKVIGGLTGDIYGANNEISEAVGLLVFLVVRTWI